VLLYIFIVEIYDTKTTNSQNRQSIELVNNSSVNYIDSLFNNSQGQPIRWVSDPNYTKDHSHREAFKFNADLSDQEIRSIRASAQGMTTHQYELFLREIGLNMSFSMIAIRLPIFFNPYNLLLLQTF
jgi:hypothetical protein